MKILLIYTTNSGSTYLASKIIENALAKDFSVTVKPAAEAKPEDLSNYDLVILGSPSWNYEGKEGMPHQMMLRLLEKLQGKFYPKKYFAIYGGGDDSYTHFCGAVDYLEKFVVEAKGELIVPSMRVNGFYFDLEKNTEAVKKWAENLRDKLKR